MTRLRAAELEVLFTANTDDVGRAEKVIKTTGDRIEKKPITQKVDADAKGAVADMKKVEDAARRVVTAKTVAKVDADIAGAEKQFTRLYEKVDYLRAIQPEMQVDADITRAVKQMERAQARLDGLRGARAVMEVDADTQPLEDATDGVGVKAGKKVGGDIEGSLIAALTAIPIAGGIVLGAKAIGQALIGGIQEGMQIEVRQDRLQALAGITPEQARKFAFASGEAYANTFGESIESNMNISRLGLQFGILDPTSTARDAQKVVEGLSGIADALEEDVKPTATAVATLLRTGLASSAEEAFDILAAGVRNGLNRNEDLLDSLNEYPTVMREMGLSGKEYLGLLNQGMKAGARNSDIVADGLKEIQLTLRNREGADALKQLGLNADDTFTAFAQGGPRAREALGEILTGMRNLESPTERNQVALDLFKTKAEDLGSALFALDLSNAVEQLGQVDGAARKMFDTLSDNDATKIEQAQRNVEVAMQGIQGALAAGFSEPLAQAAEFISQNRGPVLQFFLDLTNGALDFGATMVNSAADGAIAFSEFIAGPGADMIDMLIGIQKSINPFSDTSELEGLRDGMREADDATRATADTMRNELLGGIEQARAKVDEFGGKAVAMGYLNDASLRLAGSIADIGVQADGSKLSLEGVDAANLRASESGRTLDAQIRSAVDAMREELNTAAAAGEGQDELAARYDTTRQALYDSLVQMGLTKDQADLLIQTYGAVPSLVPTAIQTNAPEVRAEVERLKYALDNVAGTRDVIINKVVRETGADRGQVAAAYNAQGAILQPMALGGLTPMRPLAQMVPPSTYRVVGDRHDVSELYAPLDGSPRSWSLLMEGFRRMPGVAPRADGGATGVASEPTVNVGPIDARVDYSPREAEIRRVVIDAIREYNRDMYGRGGV